MKKRKLIISILFVTIIFAPLLNYYLLNDIDLYHPYEVIYQDDESPSLGFNTTKFRIRKYF